MSKGCSLEQAERAVKDIRSAIRTLNEITTAHPHLRSATLYLDNAIQNVSRWAALSKGQ